jgi:hypothetical protein
MGVGLVLMMLSLPRVQPEYPATVRHSATVAGADRTGGTGRAQRPCPVIERPPTLRSQIDGKKELGMRASLLARSAAPLAIVAGGLVVLTRVVILLTVPADVGALTVYVLTPTHAITSYVSIVAFALLLLALVASYDLQARRVRGFGLFALGVAVVGTVFLAGDWWFEAFAVPRLAEVAPDSMASFPAGRLVVGALSSFALFGIGWTLYGIASIRAHLFPAVVSWGITVGGFVSAVPGVGYLFGNIVLGLSFVVLGLWLGRARTARDIRSPVAAHR